jgi:hypothetical protein
MSAQKTNAVLSLLADVDHLQRQRNYPQSGLLFADDRWRAFYHCHESASGQNTEHGHFHLFTDSGGQAWSHVTCLGIDSEGQPLQWFTVNRWVTDGCWLESGDLFMQLDYITPENIGDNLTANWLAIMLQLYRDNLQVLLQQRDEYIQQHQNGRGRDNTLEDRDLYTLSTHDINLQKMLEKHLLYRRSDRQEAVQDAANSHNAPSSGE